MNKCLVHLDYVLVIQAKKKILFPLHLFHHVILNYQLLIYQFQCHLLPCLRIRYQFHLAPIRPLVNITLNLEFIYFSLFRYRKFIHSLILRIFPQQHFPKLLIA